MTARDSARLPEVLAAGVARVSRDRPLTVLELATGGITAFHVWLDEGGVPHQEHVSTSWDVLDSGSSVPIPSGSLMIVNSSPGTPAVMTAQDRLRTARPDAEAWVSGGSLAGLLADTIADSPIRQQYELLVAQADLRTNQIRLHSHLLFAVGARRGDMAEATVRCGYAGNRGVTFAVIAREGHTPRLLWAGLVRLQPGRYRVRAELLGPGMIRFTQPTGIVSDNRSLKELMDAVPMTLNSVKQARIICAVELSGLPHRVAARLYRAEKIIKKLDQQLPEPGQLQVGIIGYGAHRSERKSQDERVIVSKWMSPPDEALNSLGWLGVADIDYAYAAQMEDVLAEVVRRLDSIREPRPGALILLGDRPPYPSDGDGGFAGCPNGHDWRKSLGILKKRPDITIVAIRDDLSATGTEAWASLGSAVLLSLEEVDEYQLGLQIGLISPSLQEISFPLVDSDEASIARQGD